MPAQPQLYPATPAGLLASVFALGDTPDAVAAALTTGGYTGQPATAAECPIAHYLTSVIPDACGAAVCTETVCVFTLTGLVEVDAPYATAEFVAAFDHGRYRHLATSVEGHPQ